MGKKKVEYNFKVVTRGNGILPANHVVGNISVATKSTDIDKVKDIGFENLSTNFQSKKKFDFNGCSSVVELVRKHFDLELIEQ